MEGRGEREERGMLIIQWLINTITTNYMISFSMKSQLDSYTVQTSWHHRTMRATTTAHMHDVGIRFLMHYISQYACTEWF